MWTNNFHAATSAYSPRLDFDRLLATATASSPRLDFDRLLAAAVASREDEAELRVTEALEKLSAAISRAEAAEKRAEAAEEAKIELTLAMARGDSEDGSSTACSRGMSSVHLPRDTRRQAMLGSATLSFSGDSSSPHYYSVVIAAPPCASCCNR
jgi:hypothetical protein